MIPNRHGSAARRWGFRLAFLVALALLLLRVLPPARADSGNALWFSDLHFDPFYDSSLVTALNAAEADGWQAIFAGSAITSPAAYGEETNYPLLTGALDQMVSEGSSPDFILISGDFICHNFSDKYQAATGDLTQAGLNTFINKTMAFLAGQITSRFPGTPVYPALGNNDSHTGDYHVQPNGTFLSYTATLFADSFIKSAGNKDAFAASYPVGGYYPIVPPHTPGARILALNSVFFSVNYPDPPDVDNPPDPAGDELAWLEAKLELYRQQGNPVWLVHHIPPGPNVYNTIHDAVNQDKPISTVTLFYKDEPLAELLRLLREYHPEVVASFPGHTHMDDFRFMPSGTACAPVLGFSMISPAISPQFGNNPGFCLLTYDRDTFALQDYSRYYLDLTGGAPWDWALEYTFTAAYPGTALSPAGMGGLYCRMGQTTGQYRQNYADFYNASHAPSPLADPRDYRAYWCGMGRAEPRAFADCVNQMAGVLWYLLAPGN